MKTTPAQAERNRRPLAFVKRTYHNILRRTAGLDPTAKRYAGLPVGFTRDEFVAWTMLQPKFWSLYAAWQKSGYQRSFAPSIDRIDDWKGYTPGNVQWIRWSENQKKPHPRMLRLLTFNGKTQSLAAWSKEMGMREPTLRGRLRRWNDDVSRALTTPVDTKMSRYHTTTIDEFVMRLSDGTTNTNQNRNVGRRTDCGSDGHGVLHPSHRSNSAGAQVPVEAF